MFRPWMLKLCGRKHRQYKIIIKDRNGNATLDCLIDEAILVHNLNSPGKPYEISGADCVIEIREVKDGN